MYLLRLREQVQVHHRYLRFSERSCLFLPSRYDSPFNWTECCKMYRGVFEDLLEPANIHTINTETNLLLF